MGFFRVRAAAALIGGAAVFCLAVPPPDSAASLLRRAMENQDRRDYSAEVLFVRQSFLKGADSLRGRLEFRDQSGERQLRLEGREAAFEWWSRNFGQEQWWKEGDSARLHRIPFRSLKKPAFASLLTYEDLAKLPGDYLLDFESCQKLEETDSTYELKLLLKPGLQSRYGSLEIRLIKKPLLLRRVVFYAPGGRKLKSLEVAGYRPSEGGRYLPSELRVFNGDSLASLRMSLIPSAVAGADKTEARKTPPVAHQTRLEPTGAQAGKVEEAEAVPD